MKKLIAAALLIAAFQWAIAQTSPHGELKIGCEKCHTTNSWKMRSDAAFDHGSTGFELTGIHKKTECKSCHEGLKFDSAQKTCNSCHTDVHKAGLGLDCLRCHTTQNWNITDMIQRHQQTRFPLVGRHATAQCQSCHTQSANQQYTGTPITCLGCHRNDYLGSQNPNHTAAGFSTECTQCHNVNAAVWSNGFDHQLTAFPLSGSHRTVQCIRCHTNNAFKSTPQDCYTCHLSNFNEVQNPNHAAGRYPHDCTVCHTTTVWRPSTFSHANTAFPLVGAHQAVACASCHVNNVYAGLHQNCIDCHRNDFNTAANPNHAAGNFSTTCTMCHSMNGWSPAAFDHSTTKFALTGKHSTALCQDCHTSGNYQLVFTGCYPCHQKDFTTAANPNHTTANFSHICETCHTTLTWSPATFDHSLTKFALTGKHLTILCQDCHTGGNYRLVYTDCNSCHQKDFTTAANPNHVAGGFSTACTTCHTTIAWSPATFDHSLTKFALTGTHSTTLCASCHTSNNYQLVFTGCYPCHQADFQKPANPNHAAGNFAHTCEQCHTTTVWRPSTFSHANTPFPLVGAHQAVACASCHVNNVYAGLHQNCIDCHRNDFNTAANPNHAAGNFSTTCTTCHSMNGWTPAIFDHSTTKFALTGRHTTVLCQDCHTNGNYQLAFTGCVQCHQADFNTAANPNHAAGGFSTTCTTCHTTIAWSPSSFDHSTTKFTLTGKHATVLCQTCHTNGNYQLAFTGCVQCHQTDFNTAANPNHAAGGFSTTCTTCHTTTAWSPATFDHSTTKFALTGTHSTTLCQNCHTNGNYQLIYSGCYPCHQADFQKPTNPNHVTGNFAHTCEQCHSTTVWTPSTFSHANTSFPLVGAHQAVPCASCHVNNVFAGLHQNCIDCHQNDFNTAANPNHAAGNFSTTCTTCHSMNAWSPATFDHSTTKFALTGKHTTVACQVCHTNGNYQLAFTGCVQCHLTDFNTATNPNHAAGGFSTTCTACHSTTAWSPATFNHATTKFALTGAHTTVLCQTCHTNGNYQLVYTTCYQCHATDFTAAKAPVPHTGFSTTCTTCHTTNAWSPSTFVHTNTTPRFPTDSRHRNAACTKCHQNAANYTIICCLSSGCHDSCAGGD